MLLKTSERSREWLKRLQEVVFALNNEETRLTGAKPVDAIKNKQINSKPSAPPAGRPVGLKEPKLDYSLNLRCLLAPGELEGGQKRAKDLIWSLKVYNIKSSVVSESEPVLYYLNSDAIKR